MNPFSPIKKKLYSLIQNQVAFLTKVFCVISILEADHSFLLFFVAKSISLSQLWFAGFKTKNDAERESFLAEKTRRLLNSPNRARNKRRRLKREKEEVFSRKRRWQFDH